MNLADLFTLAGIVALAVTSFGFGYARAKREDAEQVHALTRWLARSRGIDLDPRSQKHRG